jgi:hypothetical protein
MSSPVADLQVQKALADLGWLSDQPVFGNRKHVLETAPFILAPEKASVRSSIDIKTDTGAAFLNFLSKCC